MCIYTCIYIYTFIYMGYASAKSKAAAKLLLKAPADGENVFIFSQKYMYEDICLFTNVCIHMYTYAYIHINI